MLYFASISTFFQRFTSTINKSLSTRHAKDLDFQTILSDYESSSVKHFKQL